MAASRSGIITLTSDFGVVGSYVGAMRGVVLSRFAGARLVDITHAIAAQDISEGSRVLTAACPWFPAGTVHVAVVDPGVGTARAGVVVAAGDHVLVGPDNGLLVPLAMALGGGEHRAYRIENSAWMLHPVSGTFHGRDVFAPTAAALAAGAVASDAGSPLTTLVELADPPRPEVGDRHIRGAVVHVDGFGNIITNIPRELLPDSAALNVTVDAHTVDGGFVRVYGDAPAGAGVVALVGSEGLLEVATPGGSAALTLGRGVGSVVEVRW